MKNTIIITAAATSLLLVSCKNPAGSSTEARVSEAQEVSTEAITGTKWVFADSSTITFTGSKVTGSHEGGFNRFTGHFYVDGITLAPSGHKIVIDMTSTYSDAEKLTGHLTSADFFDVATYPTSTFTVTGIEEKSGARGETHVLTGNFDFHGVTKSITIPVVVSPSDKEINVTADFFINRFDFNIEYPGKTDDLIRKEVVIKFNLKATPAAPAKSASTN
ncbi:MAG: YceI family protein [Akkermansiaceae bacterium]|nr:YceI family protein [Akkermansiaceae bacterium]